MFSCHSNPSFNNYMTVRYLDNYLSLLHWCFMFNITRTNNYQHTWQVCIQVFVLLNSFPYYELIFCLTRWEASAGSGTHLYIFRGRYNMVLHHCSSQSWKSGLKRNKSTWTCSQHVNIQSYTLGNRNRIQLSSTAHTFLHRLLYLNTDPNHEKFI